VSAGEVVEFRGREGVLGVAGGEMGDFVGHHAGQFGFALGGKNQRAIYVEEASRKSVRPGISLESMSLTVNGTSASELRTIFWATRFT